MSSSETFSVQFLIFVCKYLTQAKVLYYSCCTICWARHYLYIIYQFHMSWLSALLVGYSWKVTCKAQIRWLVTRHSSTETSTPPLTFCPECGWQRESMQISATQRPPLRLIISFFMTLINMIIIDFILIIDGGVQKKWNPLLRSPHLG